MVVKERKGNWSPRRLFRYVCVGCGHRLDDRQPTNPAKSSDVVSRIRWLSDR